MAMDLTVLDDALKVRWISEKVHNHAWKRETIFKKIKDIRKDYTGKEFSWLIETYPGEEGSYAANGAQLNTAPTDEGYKRVYFDLKTMRSIRHLDVEAAEDAADSAGSLVRPIKVLPKKTIENHVFHIARNFWCDSGKIALCGTTTSSAEVELATNSNMRRFKRKMTMDVVESDDGRSANKLIDSEQILTIEEGSTPSLTFTSTCNTTATNDVICFEDESYSSSTNYATYAWNGLPTLVGTGNVFNLTISSDAPEFISKVATSTGVLTLPKMQDIVDWIEARSEQKISEIRMSPESAQKYGGLLIPDMRFSKELLDKMSGGQVGTTMSFKGGSMGEIPIVRDPLMPKDEIYFLTWPSFCLATTAFLKWLNLNGTYYQWVSNYLKFALIMYSRGEFGVLNRNWNGKMTGVTI